MKTPWWFRLYTLHTLKFFAYVTAAQFVLYFLLASAGGMAAKMAGGVVLLAPVLYYFKHVSHHFRLNIEFHKMSIPFPQLKRAFFYDIIIKQTVFSLLFLLNLYIAISISGGMKMASEFMVMTPAQLLYYVPLYFLGSASTMTFYKESKYQLFVKHKSFFVNIFMFSLFITAGGVLTVCLVGLGYDVPFIAGYGVASLTTGVLLFRSKAIFHQYRPVGRIRDGIKFIGYGTAICLSFYLFAVLFSRNDVLNTNYSTLQRASSLQFAGPFTPDIDKETFTAIEPHLAHEELSILYSKADFPVGSLGLEYFLDNDPNSRRLMAMLAHSKPDPVFLSALYDHFDHNPDYWNEKYGALTFKVFAYSKWPTKVLPEQYSLAKSNTLKEIELKKEERKRKREIASKKRSR